MAYTNQQLQRALYLLRLENEYYSPGSRFFEAARYGLRRRETRLILSGEDVDDDDESGDFAEVEVKTPKRIRIPEPLETPPKRRKVEVLDMSRIFKQMLENSWKVQSRVKDSFYWAAKSVVGEATEDAKRFQVGKQSNISFEPDTDITDACGRDTAHDRQPNKMCLSSYTPGAGVDLEKAIKLGLPSSPTLLQPNDKTLAYSSVIPNVLGVIKKDKRSTAQRQVVISTSFAHPIDFTHSPPANGSNPCHWCYDFTYGILGLGQIQIQVMEQPDGRGYSEIRDGHSMNGKEPSRMCNKCTKERVRAMQCGSHNMQPIIGIDKTSFAFSEAIKTLLPDAKEGRCIKRNLWCAICISPALYQCGQPLAGTELEAIRGVGSCGLVLCGNCVSMLGASDGRVCGLVERLWKMGTKNLRADAEFFRVQGELRRRFRIGERMMTS
ncbi:hypothetical protein LOZ58_005678 [Ophidiomyces ophidiicola]|nr:hypothetical protein LOZ65_006055 [Ophidiomyces ophidiicola]KAI1957592.1 hypothetical protein LOZ58_005678 [Ophidiomyces ophidiicola]